MSNIVLTEEQAYLAMYAFLEEYYELTGSDEIGGLLGSMSLLEDGDTADSAILEDWKTAINKVIENKVNAKLKLNKE